MATRDTSSDRFVSLTPYPGSDLRTGDQPWVLNSASYSNTDWGSTRLSGSVNDFMYISNASQDGILNTGTNEFIFSCFIRINDVNTRQTLFAKYSGGSSISSAGVVGFSIEFRGDMPQKYIELHMNDGTNYYFQAAGIIIGTGRWLVDREWHHLLISARLSKTQLIVVYDEQDYLSSFSSTLYVNSLTNSGDFRIGKQSGTGTGQNLSADICMISFWVFDDTTLLDYAMANVPDPNPLDAELIMCQILATRMCTHNDYANKYCKAIWYGNHDGTEQRFGVAGNYLNTSNSSNTNAFPITTRVLQSVDRTVLDDSVIRDDV